MSQRADGLGEEEGEGDGYSPTVVLVVCTIAVRTTYYVLVDTVWRQNFST